MSNIENTLDRLRTFAEELPGMQNIILNELLLELEAYQDEVSETPNRLSDDISYLINEYQKVIDGKPFEIPVEDKEHLRELEALHKRVIEKEYSCIQEYLDLLYRHMETSKKVKERLIKERDEILAQIDAKEKKMVGLESALS
ncbi:MAG: hypothetical protein HWE07_14105 [Cytophagia bacterium]|nr:hypothetical protein [Cytophagia bacterium]